MRYVNHDTIRKIIIDFPLSYFRRFDDFCPNFQSLVSSI